MNEKLLLGYSFSFVCEIELARNLDGSIKEFYPEKNYTKKEKLHKYGTGPFCRFSIPAKWSGIMGVYAIFFNDDLKYVGQCLDFAKRYNVGYGQIQPRNCFVNGQSTNCKINKLILNAAKNDIKVELYFHETNCYDEIESKLIDFYSPEYNDKKGKTLSKNWFKAELSQGPKTTQTDLDTKPSTKFGVKDVCDYIQDIFIKSKEQGLKQIDLISGKVHGELRLKQRMPTVCDAMYKLKKEKDIIVYAPPKGKGSKLQIRYFL